jgi:hypothetical protein
VWGISLLLLSGFLAFASDLRAPWWQLTAIGFGVGAALTLDEFALWLHLEDVYWAEQGRSSIDAVVIAALFAGLVVVGVRPFGLDEPADVGKAIAVVLPNFALVSLTFLKGRLALGVLAVFVPVVGLVCALRLAKPGLPWARRMYENRRPERLRPRPPPLRRGPPRGGARAPRAGPHRRYPRPVTARGGSRAVGDERFRSCHRSTSAVTTTPAS